MARLFLVTAALLTALSAASAVELSARLNFTALSASCVHEADKAGCEVLAASAKEAHRLFAQEPKGSAKMTSLYKNYVDAITGFASMYPTAWGNAKFVTWVPAQDT